MKKGDKIGMLTLIKKVPKPEEKTRTGTYWLCQCLCGNYCVKHYHDLYTGDSKSCGCLRKRAPIYDKKNMEISNKAGIYGFQNIYNGKWYIGKSKNLYRRYCRHKSEYKKNTKKQFYQALNKYGWESFNYYILQEYEQIPSDLILSQAEEFFIKEKCAYTNGYNATNKSSGGFVSEQHKKKCTEILNELNKKQKGVNHPRASLNKEQVTEIFSLAMEGCPFSEAWEKYKNKLHITKEIFQSIYNGYSYKNLLPEEWDARPMVYTNSTLWGIDITDIRKRFLKGEKPKEIYKDYQEKCSWCLFKRVINNKTYKHIQPCID